MNYKDMSASQLAEVLEGVEPADPNMAGGGAVSGDLIKAIAARLRAFDDAPPFLVDEAQS